MSQHIRKGTLQDGAWIKKVPSCYTTAEALQYLTHIGVDVNARKIDLGKGPLSTSRELLTEIVIRHLLAFSFENTSMHYSADHDMDVSPAGIFKRLVIDKKGGSYCFGMNGLLLGVLRALGFRAYAGAARVNEAPPGPPDYTSLTHQVLFVQPEPDSNQTYLVDVGFGSPGLSQPILLSNAPDNSVLGVHRSEKHQLSISANPFSSVETKKGSDVPHGVKWNLEVIHQRCESANPAVGRILYTFTEEEFFPKDFEDANFVISKMPNPRGLFWSGVVCVKYFLLGDTRMQKYAGKIRDEIRSGETICRMTLFGRELKRNFGCETELVRTVKSEVERMIVLRDLFGIDVRDEDAKHIAGRVAAIA